MGPMSSIRSAPSNYLPPTSFGSAMNSNPAKRSPIGVDFPRHYRLKCMILLFVAIGQLAWCSISGAEEKRPPNIVFILADDK